MLILLPFVMHPKLLFFALFLTIFCLWTPLAECFDDESLIELMQSSAFIDKTKIMTEFFRDDLPKESFKYYFITRPRGFGKTTNLQLIRKFAAIEVDDHGKPKPQKESSAYKLYKNTTIGSSQHEDFFGRHFNQYPVIYLDLEFQREELLDSISRKEALSRIVRQFYEPYEWMLNHLTDRSHVEMIESNMRGGLDDNAVKKSLHELWYILKSYFNKQEVILLVDNFDSAVRHFVLSAECDIKQVYEVIQEMLRRICGGESAKVEFAMITGITSLNFHLPGFPEGTKHFAHYPFLKEDQFAEYYGFTDDDLKMLYEQMAISKKKQKRYWKLYKGYAVKKETKEVVKLLNPIFVAGFVQSINDTVKDRWAVKESFEYLNSFVKCELFRKKMAELLKEKSLSLESLPKEHQPGKLQGFLESSDRDYSKLGEEDVLELWTYFFEHGWLSHDAENPNIYCYPTVGAGTELRKEFHNLMDQNYKMKGKIRNVKEDGNDQENESSTYHSTVVAV